MKILRIDRLNPEPSLVSLAKKALEGGKILIYPTDTVYGIGCALDGPVERLYGIKNRPRDQPLSIACLDLEMVKEYCVLSPREESLIVGKLGGAYTFILEKRPSVPDIVTAGLPSVGVRIIDHPVVYSILKALKKPIITTSANLSGQLPPASFEDVSIEADLAIESGRCPRGMPSTVFDVRTGRVFRSS